jgi:metal-responsive CopG/Arc/MetJ family transcriptional regulator
MKVKASFTISDKTLKAVDRIVGRAGNRSAFVEQALEAALKQHEREVRDARDAAIIDANIEEITAELDADCALVAAVNLEAIARRRKQRK